MRKIKFRCWDILAKQMFYPDTWSRLCGFGDEGYKLMQYTGLKDKNGKEIYEGDIIQFPHVWNENGKPYYVEIYWRQSLRHGIGFYEKKGKDIYTEPDGEFYARKGEVVGNIWENGELLDK